MNSFILRGLQRIISDTWTIQALALEVIALEQTYCYLAVFRDYFPNNLPAFDWKVISFVQYTGGKTEFDERLWKSTSYSTGSFSALVVREVVCKTNIIFNNDVPARIRINTTTHTRLLEIPFFLFAMVRSILARAKQRTFQFKQENLSTLWKSILREKETRLKTIHLLDSCPNISKLFPVFVFPIHLQFPRVSVA